MYKKVLLLISIIIVSAGVYFTWNGQNQEAALGTIKENFKCTDCNLIMISLSNVSAENMSLYGYERLTTPALEKWAEDAIVFENAFTQTSWTLPVATSLFTSLYPYSHKVVDRFTDNVLDKNIQTLPEILRTQGYKTAAFTGGLDYDARFGHMRGFEEVEEAEERLLQAVSFSGFQSTLQRASEWLGNNSGEKVFLFLHGYDTHCPFDPPERFRGTFSVKEGRSITVDNTRCLRGYKNSDDDTYEAYYYRDKAQKVILTQDDITYLTALYDEEILSVDTLVGDFLDGLDEKILDNTIIVIFSDHGEMFAKHGRFGRAGTARGTLYDDVMHIPLMIKTPQRVSGVVSGLVEIIDVMPTVLGMLGIPAPSQVQGESLLQLMAEEKEVANEYVFAGSKFGLHENRPVFQMLFPVRTISEYVRNKEWKLLHETYFNDAGAVEEDIYELYNLNDDPDELRNLVGAYPAVTEKLKGVLEAWGDQALSYSVQNVSSPQLLPDEIIEAAREAGYW